MDAQNLNIFNTNFKNNLDFFDGKYLNFSYKRVQLFFKNIKENKVVDALYCLDFSGDFPSNEFIQNLYKMLISGRFISPKSDLELKVEKGEITNQQANDFIESDKVFDELLDFDLIYSLFKERFNIDLIDEDINYFKYKMMLEHLFLEEKNPLINRINARNFKPMTGKNVDQEYNRIGDLKKKKYSISSTETTKRGGM